MKATVTIDPQTISYAEAASCIVGEADEKGLNGVPSAERLTSLLEQEYQEKGVISDFVLCSGTPPQPSEDGRLIWARDFFSTDFVKDEY